MDRHQSYLSEIRYTLTCLMVLKKGLAMNIFVYGTLLKGMIRYPVLSGSPFSGMGFTLGRLYDLGDYPAIGNGNDLVYGELYEIDIYKFGVLDRIEGYNPQKIRQSLYVRKEITCTMLADGSKIDASAYFFNDSLKKYDRIIHGDYRRYKLENLSEKQWYIAYGSNMSLSRLTERVGAPYEWTAGYLEGYQLVFNKKADNGGVYANIAYKGIGFRCPFVAYRITAEQLSRLDRFEGEPAHYLRIGLPFPDADGLPNIGHVYIANPGKLVQSRNPSAAYLQHIVDGYKEHGFETGSLSIGATN